jgi:hypothetical protein
MKYEINQKVWVKCANTNAWVSGFVTGTTEKRVRVYNEVRCLEGLYALQNVSVK